MLLQKMFLFLKLIIWVLLWNCAKYEFFVFPKIKAVLEMTPISPDNFNPDIPSSELSLLPEWHCKKWAMAIVNRVNGNLLS